MQQSEKYLISDRNSSWAGRYLREMTVLEKNPHKRHGKVLCRCACGTEKKVFVSNLRSGPS